MEIMNDFSNTDSINKKGIAISIIVIILVLSLAVWGGMFLGKSRASTQNQKLNTDLALAQDQISQLQTTSVSLQGEKEHLQTQLSLAQDQLSQLQLLYNSLQESDSALQTQLTSAQQNLTILQEQLTADYQNISTLQTQLIAANQNISILQAQLMSAQENAATLQTQLLSWYEWSNSAPPSPRIILSPTSGVVGSSVATAGNGFPLNTGGNVVFDTNQNGVFDTGETVQSVTTSSTGTFSTTLVVPSVSSGEYFILAVFPVGMAAQVSAIFTVTTDNSN
jgi:hypothetical protein